MSVNLPDWLPRRRCDNCAFYNGGDCLMVVGKISPDGVSSFHRFENAETERSVSDVEQNLMLQVNAASGGRLMGGGYGAD